MRTARTTDRARPHPVRTLRFRTSVRAWRWRRRKSASPEPAGRSRLGGAAPVASRVLALTGLVLAFALAPALLAGPAAAAAAGAAGAEPDLEREYALLAQAKELRREINLHNLFNGLNLTVAQMRRIVALAREARSLREECFGAESAQAGKVVHAYRRIRSVVARGGRIPKDLEGLGGLMELAEKRLRRRYFESMAGLEAKVLAALSAGQRKILETYEPCLIPPQSLREPVSVGQAKPLDQAREILDMTRRLPEAGFDAECRRILETRLQILEKFLGRMDEGVREQELDRMVGVCRRARAIGDVDYALKVTDLAEELALDRPKDLFKAKAEEFLGLVQRIQGGHIGKIAKHFLDPIVVGLLEARIERARRGGDGEGSAPGAALASRRGAASRPRAPAPGLPGDAPGRKYGFGEVCQRLGIDGDGRERFHQALARAKEAHLRVLQTPLADGTIPLERFLRVQTLPPAQRQGQVQALFLALQEPLPGEDEAPMERILRIKMALDRDVREALTPAQYAGLAALVDDLLDKVELGQEKGKPTVADVAGRLGCSRRQAAALAEAFRKGKAEAMQVLSTPDGEGRRPLDLIVRAQTAPPERRQAELQAFFASLAEPMPGTGTTYAAALERIKGKIRQDLEAAVSAEQVRRFEAMGIDVLDVETQ